MVTLAPATSTAEGLKLGDAVKLALEHNERARKTPLRVEAAEGQLDRARSAFFPTLGASGTSTYRPDPGTRASSLTNSANLTLTQPLVNPSAFPQYSQQQHTRESERLGSVQDRRQLAFETAKAFVQTLTAERILESAKRKAETARLNVESTQARAQAGLTSSNDVTRARLQLATSQAQVASTEGSVTRAYVGLSFLVGQRVSPPLVTPDNTTRAAQRYEEARSSDVRVALERREHAITVAQGRRPDVLAQHERTEAARQSAKEPNYRMIPSLNASGQLRFVPDPQPTEKAVDPVITLNLSWQLFDAGVRYADRRVRLAQLASAELDEQLLRRSVQTDVELALATLRAARASLKAADEAASAAAQNTEETLILYRQGLARAIEVNDANDRQFEAETTRESTKLTMEQAYLDLRSALGFGPLDEGAR